MHSCTLILAAAHHFAVAPRGQRVEKSGWWLTSHHRQYGSRPQTPRSTPTEPALTVTDLAPVLACPLTTIETAAVPLPRRRPRRTSRGRSKNETSRHYLALNVSSERLRYVAFFYVKKKTTTIFSSTPKHREKEVHLHACATQLPPSVAILCST